MNNFDGMWRLITPKTRKQMYTTLSTDAYDPRTTDLSSLAAVSWYSQIMRGAGTRMQSYKQYDSMDSDIDISRSLDIIAEEMSGKDDKTDLPFIINWQKEDNQDVSDTTVVTVRAALRQWSSIQDLKKRIFSTARCMIKYGDCLFRKVSDTRKWVYVDPSLVIGVEIDENGNAVSYHLRRPGTAMSGVGLKNDMMDIVPASAMIHFSMSDDMGDSAPFGTSVLRAIFRVYKQLTMLEDAVLIHKIVRAPERRVFYIDVGNMNQQQVKRYLESIKNEIRQKRIPSQGNNGKDTVDGQFNPQCFTLDTRVPLTDGRVLSIADLIAEHEAGIRNEVFSCHPVTGERKTGEIAWAGVTRKNAELVLIALSNGKEITCTPDHKFPVKDVGFVRAFALTANMPLIGDEEVHVVSITPLERRQDTACITVGEKNHTWHTFMLDAGVFTKNSLQEDYFFPVTASGKGSRVETLPGGAEDFGTNLLGQFQEKIFRGLRIPTSYMGSTPGGGTDPQFNDGKVGIAYIEELRFANFISRLQDRLNEVYDREFKIYLKVCGLQVDDEVFQIKLPDPANFALYRQAALDADLINAFGNVQETKFLSRRFIMKRYLGLSDDEIQMNEVLVKEEKNLVDTPAVPLMQQLYDEAVYANRDSVKVEKTVGAEEASGGEQASADGALGMEPDAGLMNDTAFPDGEPEPSEPTTDEPTEPAEAPEAPEAPSRNQAP